jgi:hypothetical protein
MNTQLTLVTDRSAALRSLPAGHSIRWVAARKAQVVEAVETGLLRLEDALSRYRLSREEFEGWQEARTVWGVRALHVKRSKVRGFGRKNQPLGAAYPNQAAL